MCSEIKKNLEESQELFEIARIGFTNDGYEIYVNTDDIGSTPSFHYRKKGSWEGHTSICLDKAEYFHHGDKQAVLNKKQRKELANFLGSKPLKTNRYDTNWNLLISMWNVNNSTVEIDSNLPMPNYLELK